MFQKKICMLGAFAVGKTSLITRYITNSFDEKYSTTIGVSIKRKTLCVGREEGHLLLWDLAGEDEFHQIQPTYVRGADGYFLIVDGTRQATLETAFILHQRVVSALGEVPFMVLLNKVDLTEAWEVDEPMISDLAAQSWGLIETSAKTGLGVEDAFARLAGYLI
ncbi:MAG: GTP-binding protein [Candidatus Tectomicrobia bacterium]|nr:GTP-binding protein [Candidatus Tectomicrobia bacterium]